FVVAACAALAMSGDREPMRLVADALDHAQGLRVGTGCDRPTSMRGGVTLAAAIHKQPLLPRLAVRTLRDAHQLEVTEPELVEFAVHLVDLPLAAVDQQHIGCGDLTRA